jgi:hypothetical protein
MRAAAAYTLLTLVMTWPLARGLAHDVAWDLGDPLFTMWIIAWDSEQLRAILRGDVGRVFTFFEANIFHPAPLALAYSEHLVAQAVQVFPLYIATRNPILCYNLVFLSTFVLSGLGVYLLLREFTSNRWAAFLGGLLFAFAPYRWTQASHIQVLSAQWMPFVLYGLRRYFETRRTRALGGATGALVLQNLSCGYFLLYFPPVAAVYVLWEIATRRLWRDRRLWIQLAAAGAIAAVLTLPFLLPYKALRDSHHLQRETSEIVRYSADVYSYFTAADYSRVWSGVRAFPKPEGELFPGGLTLVLALAAAIAWGAGGWRRAVSEGEPGRRWAVAAAALAGCAYLALAIAVVFLRRVDLDLAFVTLRSSNVTRLIVAAMVAFVAVLALSRRARERTVAAACGPEVPFLLMLVLAWWLSLGPAPRVFGRPLEIWAPYRAISDIVPAFEGLRVPARFAAIVTFCLAVLGGMAAGRIPRTRAGTMAVGALCLAFLFETRMLPLSVNGMSPPRGYAPLEARVHRPARAPALYREIANTPADAVVLELPLGVMEYDLRAVFYSTVHWRRILNGYSGFYPPHYGELTIILSSVDRDEATAWEAVTRLGVSHVVVHEGAYLDGSGPAISAWLRRMGALEIFRSGTDALFHIPR